MESRYENKLCVQALETAKRNINKKGGLHYVNGEELDTNALTEDLWDDDHFQTAFDQFMMKFFHSVEEELKPEILAHISEHEKNEHFEEATGTKVWGIAS